MPEHAEFRLSRRSDGLTGVGLLLIAAAAVYSVFFTTDEDLLSSHARKTGILKLMEHTIGWGPYATLLLLFGAWAAVSGVIYIWRALDARPDVVALADRMEFHPTVRRAPARYEDVSHWSLEGESASPVIQIHFLEPYWSLYGMAKRKTLTLVGTKEQVSPIFDFFATNPAMVAKYRRP